MYKPPPPPLKAGVYAANITSNGYECSFNDQKNIYSTDSTLPAIFTITNYTGFEKILSGTFEMTMVNYINKDTLKLTNGRFDIKKQ